MAGLKTHIRLIVIDVTRCIKRRPTLKNQSEIIPQTQSATAVNPSRKDHLAATGSADRINRPLDYLRIQNIRACPSSKILYIYTHSYHTPKIISVFL